MGSLQRIVFLSNLGPCFLLWILGCRKNLELQLIYRCIRFDKVEGRVVVDYINVDLKLSH